MLRSGNASPHKIIENKKEAGAVVKQGFRDAVGRVSTRLLWLFGAIYVVVLALHWINAAGLIGPDSPIYGFDYFPSYMLLYLAVPVFLIGIIDIADCMSGGVMRWQKQSQRVLFFY